MGRFGTVKDSLDTIARIECTSHKLFLDSGAFSFMKKRDRLGVYGVDWTCMIEYLKGIKKYIIDGCEIYVTPNIFEEQERRIPRFSEGHPFSSALAELLQEITACGRLISVSNHQQYRQTELLVARASEEHGLSTSDQEVWITALCIGAQNGLPVAFLSDDGGIACAHAVVQDVFPNTTMYDRQFGGAFGTPFEQLTRERLYEKIIERPKRRLKVCLQNK